MSILYLLLRTFIRFSILLFTYFLKPNEKENNKTEKKTTFLMSLQLTSTKVRYKFTTSTHTITLLIQTSISQQIAWVWLCFISRMFVCIVDQLKQNQKHIWLKLTVSAVFITIKLYTYQRFALQYGFIAVVTLNYTGISQNIFYL